MSDSNPPPTDALTAATQMVKNGRLDLARETLMQYLMKNPTSEQAWLLMSYVLPDPAKQKDCLERVLKINPNNTVAQSKLAHLLGRRTEELFKKGMEPSQSAASKPQLEYTPEPELEQELEQIPAPIIEPPQPVKKPMIAPVPVSKSEPEAGRFSEPGAIPEPASPPQKKSPFSGKWFRIITIILVALIMVIIAVILYIGVIGPALNSLSITPTPTSTPVNTPAFPTKWTQTLTPTESLTPLPTETPALAPSLAPNETTIS
ncbi:MAG: hypothetical protein A3K46_05275 [Chloroflexi bacterium RBG_13_60_9]|nr:MAG: hypothetical protein A3K46_05275 [Chloroflexi bacterium RBG_13_60_9]